MTADDGGTGERDPELVTPDAVGLDLELATIGSRGVAYLLDLALLVIGLVVLSLAQSALIGGLGASSSAGVALVLVLLFAWQFGYPIAFETLWRGRTLGKAAMGLRVVTSEGAPVGVRHATVRAVLAVVELLGTAGLLAIVVSFASPRAQRLGDLAAGTYVIRERRAAGTPRAETFTAPSGYERYVAQLDVSAIGAREYAMVRDALRRGRELPAEAARAVLADVLANVVGRIRPAPPPEADAETVLRCIAAAVQARRSPTAATAPRPVDGAARTTGPAATGPAATGPAATGPATTGPDGDGVGGGDAGTGPDGGGEAGRGAPAPPRPEPPAPSEGGFRPPG